VVFPRLGAANVVMIFLLAVVVAATVYGRGPSVLAALVSVAAFDFFFVPPYLTFRVSDTEYLVTFGVMLAVAFVISGLTLRIGRGADAARDRELRTAALYTMSREFAEATAVPDLVAIAARHVGAVFDADVRILVRGADGRLAGTDPHDAGREDAVASWVLEHARPAGPGEEQRSDDASTYLPLLGQRGAFGVVRIWPRRRRLVAAGEPRRQLETFVNQTALALERARLGQEAEDARIRAESERLHSALLTSVSHDLRTPLATITGAATAMLDRRDQLDDRTRVELLESIRNEAERLNRIVGNLLGMTRLESGALHLCREWHPLEEIVGAALGRQARRLGVRRVTETVPPDLPLVFVDDVLIEQLLENLFDNAVKHTPPTAAIRIIATASERAVIVEVADGGPGLPRDAEDKVFEKFYRGPADARDGAGLGLAICRGIVEAHGGRIWAQNLPEGGVAFLFTLPLTGAPSPVPTDA
jgi:two-component system sensor histidine kinase KdpD